MIEALALPFFQRALAAGLLVGAAASLLGVFVVARRSAFFGDAVAHASLAGVALGVVLGASPLALAAAVAVGIALLLHRLERRGRLPADTILGFVLPFFMAAAILILSLSPGYQPELFSYLFGSILAVGPASLAVTAGIAATVTLALARRGRHLIFATFDPDGARVSGIRVDRLLVLYQVLLALVVVAGIKVVGVVLINALLVIPAAAAKLVARSLRQMFFLTPAIGLASVILGLAASYRLDLPSGPAVAVVAGLFFLGGWAAGAPRRATGGRGAPSR
ncbi:MAG TPA: metal ABC transporter permease [Thermoanaerobaculia bacterium]|nr:metal ABC transporter permease [Thermoanaerobaculia bacterium]